jgi:hypothetical protein
MQHSAPITRGAVLPDNKQYGEIYEYKKIHCQICMFDVDFLHMLAVAIDFLQKRWTFNGHRK